jgi:hypothetical protein
MFNVSKLPPHMQESVKAYIERGELDDEFLRAVLLNQLVQAYRFADHINRDLMLLWAGFLYNEMPLGEAWGSQMVVDVWMSHKGLSGRDAYHAARDEMLRQM